jgi:hypothetical protein
MELLKKIRLRIGDYMLHNKLVKMKRKIHYSGIDQVKKIGIVWDASNNEEFTSLSKFHNRMAENKTDVSILGYFPGKILPVQFTAHRYLSVVKKEEINFFYHPVSAETHNFVNNNFDVLIDLNFRQIFPLRYISSLSKASLKVGLSGTHNTSTFDLMMDLKAPVSVDEYLEQVVHYLKMINSGSVN